MQIRISDLMDGSCPEGLAIGAADEAMAARIRASVTEKLGAERPRRRRMSKTARALLLAAVLAALIGTAWAASEYIMSLRKTDAPESGYWRAVDKEGKLTEEQKIIFPDAGMVLSFEGPSERANQPEFQCWYLPSEATFGFTDAEGWSSYLSDNGAGPSIPYIVSAGNVRPGNFRLVINGEVSVVKEEDWGDWHVTMLTSDYTHCSTRWSYERANFVLLFQAEKGWLLTVTGTDPLETLEHIARELEIRDSGRLAYDGEDQFIEGIGMIDPGRG